MPVYCKHIVAAAITVICLATTSAHALTPGQRCAITKQTTLGKTAEAQLKCHVKAAVRDEPVDPACITKAFDKLHVKFVAAIARGGCVFTEDVTDWDDLDDFSEDVVFDHPGMAGSPAAQRCASRKWKAIGKALRKELRCHARSTVLDKATDSECLANAEGKLAVKFAKLEAAGGCVTSGATQAIDSVSGEATFIVTFNPARPKWAFILGADYDGALIGGLAGADAKCADQASGAGLPGTYVAWLSTSSTFAPNRLRSDLTPYALVDGTKIATSKLALSSGTLLHAIDLTASGVPRVTYVWTGTLPDGTTAAGATCTNWTSNSTLGGRGWAGDTAGTWTYHSNESCAAARPFYCFEY